MSSLLQRLARVLVVPIAFGLGTPAMAQDAAAATPASSAAVPWLYRGSDIPPDRDWVFGELANGLRYAVRKNGVPPGQVTIRMAIDAGSLNELPGEHGYAHFNEHLSFRGSKYVPDGEAKRLWQRLGATFGSDTNASTTPTQTIYKLDLPAVTPAGLEESVKVLSGMMAAPEITKAEVDAERRTVLAELREGEGPGRRAGDVTRRLFFAGQPLGDHAPIGDVASLNAGTPASLRGFHDRWYRPERAVLVIVGDGETATFEALIAKYFSDWRGVGASPPDPDFGAPSLKGPRARVVVEPGLPLSANLAVLRPWHRKNDTIAYNRGKLIESLSLRMISRRLEERARAGGSYLTAEVGQDDISRSVDGTFVQVVPIGTDWQAAVRDVRGVISEALTRPPTQADIDREAGEFAAGLQVGVEQARTQGDGDLADMMVEAVNIRETVAAPQVARDVFADMHAMLTPAALQAATRRMFGGAPMRAVLTTPRPLPDADARLLAAITGDVRARQSSTQGPPVSFAMLPKLGPPATVVKQSAVTGLDLTSAELSNGVRVLVFANAAEAGKIYVSARFGHGRQALPSDRPTVAWAGPSALLEGGVGTLDQNALDRLTSGRRINMALSIGDDAFQLRGTTRAADLDDQLRLMATALAFARWDPAPVRRVRAATLAGQATQRASPAGVLSRDLPGLLHGGDLRWATPDRKQVEALTPEAFRALWEPLLKAGPIEVSVFGDVQADKAIASVAASFGALPVRVDTPVAPNSLRVSSVTATPVPLIRTHGGPADQAIAVLAWPTSGGSDEVYESRKLDILAAIFNDRMFDQLREAEGASYSPNVSSSWPAHMAGGGNFLVTSQVKPMGVDRFFALARQIANDLATKSVSDDELARSVGPTKQAIARASSGNSFWLSELSGSSTDPGRLQALSTIASDYARITPAELQDTAKRWLVPEKSFAMAVVPGTRPPTVKAHTSTNRCFARRWRAVHPHRPHRRSVSCPGGLQRRS